jgi:hypothetical protein
MRLYAPFALGREDVGLKPIPLGLTTGISTTTILTASCLLSVFGFCRKS